MMTNTKTNRPRWGWPFGSMVLLLNHEVLALNSNRTLPSHITLRAGVLHAPPFAMIEGSSYSGFQIDLLKRLQTFALQDDSVTLDFDLSPSPLQYGAALDLVANDCNTTVNPNEANDCQKLDLIVGDYYCNPQRSLRIDFTPSWLRTTMSTVKYIGEHKHEDHEHHRALSHFTTLTQAAQAGATVCVPDGTYLMEVVMNKFPEANYLKCPHPDDCVKALEQGDCVLFADDELLLRHRASHNAQLEVTREQFNTQYLVWSLRHDMDPLIALYVKKWIYAAVANATLDELYFQYFQKELCPVGTAGEHCELPCDPVHGTANAQGVCVCESVKWTGDDCSVEVPENTNLIPDPLKYLAYIMVAINFGTIVACGIWLFWQRHTAQVRVSQPFFLALVLLGCAISTSTILAMAQEDDGQGPVPACMAIPWLYSVGFSVTFGSLYSKIRRVHRIFKAAGAMRKTAVTFQETMAVIGIVLLIDVLVLITWTVVSPLEWKRTILQQDQFGTHLESQGYCHSDDWMIFAGLIGALHLSLLGVACYLCYVSRDIPTKYSEGRTVSIAMISNLQIFLVGVPILIILGAAPQSSFFVRSVMIWMNDFVVVSLIFGHLMYSVHVRSWQEAEPEVVKAAIGQAIQSFSARGIGGSERRGSAVHFGMSQQTSFTVNSPVGGLHQGREEESQTNLNTSAQFSPLDGSALFTSNPLQMRHQQQPNFSQEGTQKSSRRSSSQQDSSNMDASSCNRTEITLTKEELEESHASLRRGQSYRIAQYSSSGYSSAHTRPLPRSFLNSSVSTQMQSNLNNNSRHNFSSHSGRVVIPPPSSWAEASLNVSTAIANLSTASDIVSMPSSSSHHNSSPSNGTPEGTGGSISEGDEEGSEQEEEAAASHKWMPPPVLPVAPQQPDVLSGERESWGDINVSSHVPRQQPDLDTDDYADEEEGHGMLDHSRTSLSSSRSSILPPANLPQEGPSRLSYAASRINTVRNQCHPPDEPQQQHDHDHDQTSDMGSKLTINTGSESFHDETDMEDDSNLQKSKRRASRRGSSSAKGPELKRTGSTAAIQRRRTSGGGGNPSTKGPSARRSSTGSTSQKLRSSGGDPSLRRASKGSSATSPSPKQDPASSRRRRSSVGSQKTTSSPPSALGGGAEMDVSDQGLYFN